MQSIPLRSSNANINPSSISFQSGKFCVFFLSFCLWRFLNKQNTKIHTSQSHDYHLDHAVNVLLSYTLMYKDAHTNISLLL